MGLLAAAVGKAILMLISHQNQNHTSRMYLKSKRISISQRQNHRGLMHIDTVQQRLRTLFSSDSVQEV